MNSGKEPELELSGRSPWLLVAMFALLGLGYAALCVSKRDVEAGGVAVGCLFVALLWHVWGTRHRLVVTEEHVIYLTPMGRTTRVRRDRVEGIAVVYGDAGLGWRESITAYKKLVITGKSEGGRVDRIVANGAVFSPNDVRRLSEVLGIE